MINLQLSSIKFRSENAFETRSQRAADMGVEDTAAKEAREVAVCMELFLLHPLHFA
jgi:hypothetical protein